MKKLFSFILVISLLTAALFMLGGCTVTQNDNQQNITPFDYEALYASGRSQPYGMPAAGTTNRARYGYTAADTQGFNGWYYMYGSAGAYTEMTRDGAVWKGGGASMDHAVMSVSSECGAVRAYAVNASGEAVIYGNFKCADGNSASADIAVYVNNVAVYGGTLSAGDTSGKYFETRVTLNTGDTVYFEVSGAGAKVHFDPVVTYENSQQQSLYHLTAGGKQYGDVFPWYDNENKQLYMGFLWSDDARTGKYNDALEISGNMLTFNDVPQANNYDVWQRYKENYRMHLLYDTNNFIDRSKYTFGIRDNMLYFDEENQRYLLIAGCYYRFDSSAQTSDLVIYASDDPFALGWTKPGNVVKAGYSHNLPECPSLMKIGDRWYVFVSVAYNTAHQVGPLQYWTGEPGADCMDVDWTAKEHRFLDGEDLCAARVTRVGDKVYMWGWIPATYDTMPWAPWAGYLNLPREVVQHADGSLGGRLDPALSRLLDFGNIFTLGDANYTVYAGNADFAGGTLSMNGTDNMVSLGSGYSRSYVTFTADMRSSDRISYMMVQYGKRYEVSVVKENGRKYLSVTSPDDTKHKNNSRIEIGSDSDVFDVKLVADGGFIEFFVNDEYALTARTAMNDAPYTAYLCSDAAADFTDVRINKLLPYGDIL